jgi:hypothetical protein
MKEPVYTTVKLGYILGDRHGSALQERTNKVQAWCKEHIGEPYQEWMFNYELPEDSLTFMCEEDAILFKLKFSL